MRQLESIELDAITRVVELALAEDVGSGDVTSLGTVPEDALCTARIVVKESGIVAGIPVARAVFAALDDALVIDELAADGDHAGSLPRPSIPVPKSRMRHRIAQRPPRPRAARSTGRPK